MSSKCDRLDRVDDFETMREWAKLYARENKRLRTRVAELLDERTKAEGPEAARQVSLELAKLHEQMDTLRRRLFGESSERRPYPGEAEAKPKKRQRDHGPTAQPKLNVETVELRLEGEDKTCPSCGGPLQELGNQAEEVERITVRARKYVLQQLRALKYRCPCGTGVHTAPLPPTHLKGGRYSLDFAIEVAVDKYVNHLPLDRQRRSMERAGLKVETNTLWDQLDALAKHLRPTYDAIREYIVGADVVGADETTWRLMGTRRRPGSKKWWAWTLTVPNAVWYKMSPSRGADVAVEALKGFEGTLMVDGYKAYETLAKKVNTSGTKIRLAHCLAHARRKLVEAEPNYPSCSEALDLLQQVFALERNVPDPTTLEGNARLQAEHCRLELRRTESRPLLAKLKKWALTQQGLPKSQLRKAAEYLLRYWKGLTAFVDDPYVPLDNNASERALRGVVLGRKNHYGSRSKRGTEVAAIFYTILDTARLCDLDPAKFLRLAVTKHLATGQAMHPWSRST